MSTNALFCKILDRLVDHQSSLCLMLLLLGIHLKRKKLRSRTPRTAFFLCIKDLALYLWPITFWTIILAYFF